MDFQIDHDLHIHSGLSKCSLDDRQTPASILQYGLDNGYKTICLTDHFWDETVPKPASTQGSYDKQTYAYIRQSLPLPQNEKIRYLFGGECDMDHHGTIGLSDQTTEELDFIILPIGHLNMNGFTLDENKIRAVDWKLDETPYNIDYIRDYWLKRFRKVIEADLPFTKMGLAHVGYIPFKSLSGVAKVFDGIDDGTFKELFGAIARKGMGVELNFNDSRYNGELRERLYRPLRLAKDCGCTFYLGSDAHHPEECATAKANFTAIVKELGLQESDKFPLAKEE